MDSFQNNLSRKAVVRLMVNAELVDKPASLIVQHSLEGARECFGQEPLIR